ncbi:MAG: HD domain-containing phosphohydrolase [Patescibacteria group bacterium]
MKKKRYVLEHILIAAGVLVAALERMHPYTKGHSQRISVIAYKLALAANRELELKLSKEDIEFIRIGALLHDIGKITVGETTLDNPNRFLTTDQIRDLEDHPYEGEQILRKSGVEFPRIIYDCVFSHHESWDGNHAGNMQGYPRGLAGKEIPIAGRIVAIADTFDAMTSQRTYQKKLTPKDAVTQLRKLAGERLDPKLVCVFIAHVFPNLQLD